MIYLVEDDANIRKLVSYALISNQFTSRDFASAAEFWVAMEEELPSLILLDRMLPDDDGLHILQTLRQSPKTKRLPVIILTAKSEEYDRVLGLESGADDYLCKPFGMMELLARIKALLRRAEAESTEYQVGDLYVCPEKHLIKVQNQQILLALKEYELLCYLIEAEGKVVTREQLLRDIWGYSFDGESRTIDVHIRKLRQKLGSCASLIQTVKGVGYRIGDPND